jgi:Protein of unknown function (DUF4232)
MKVRIALAALAGIATLATVGVTTAATAANAGTTGTTTTAKVSYPLPGCTVGQLTATLSGPTTGYSRSDVLTLTNTSRSACTLPSYPGLQLLTARYRPLPTTTIKVTYRSPAWQRGTIVLLPGQSVTATISYAVYRPWYGWYRGGPPFYGARAAYLVVTLPSSYLPGQNMPWWAPRQFTLTIPGGPVRIMQDRLYQTALMGHPYYPW